mgnify:CR=1 FL=1
MVTENINIVVRERGARVVRRRLEDIGNVAERSVRGLRLLQNALFVIGGAGLLVGLGRIVDTVANFQNRLSLLTQESRDAAAIQGELFDIARRSRTEFETVAQVYTRVALATRALGLSTREVLDFTESLQQASILSGASVRETNASLIQLAQALASNRFSGDEFRSVAEQLPFIIDVIGDSLGVTRGEVRQLGIEGKLTAGVILKAFREARIEISEKFARTVPTLSQSFTVFRSRLTEVIGGLNQATGTSAALAQAIISISDNLEFLIGGLVAAAAGFAALKLVGFVTSAVASVRASRQLAAAVAAGNATLLTSVEIERAKAASSLASAQATAANAASKVREIQVNNAALTQQIALLRQQQASIVIDNQRRRARDALTGRFIAYNAAVAQNIRTNRALLLTERALTSSKASLTAATTAQTAATNALAVAQGRSAAAGAAANTLIARLARAFPGLASVIGIATRALSGFFALIVANPKAAIVVAIAAAVAALAIFSNRIAITADGVVTLRDFFVATFQLIGEAIASVTNFLGESFSRAFNGISAGLREVAGFFGRFFGEVLNVIKAGINGLIALFVGGFNAVVAVWNLLPQAFERLGALAINGLVNIVDAGIEGIVQGVGDLLQFIGSAFTAVGLSNPFEGLLDDFSVDLERFLQDVPDAIGDIGSIAAGEFLEAFERDFVGEAFQAILDRARLIAEERLANLGNRGGPDGDSPDLPGRGAAGGAASFADIVRDLTLQNELLRVNASERERLNAILQIENELKRTLTETERPLVEGLLRENEVLTRAAEIYEQINAPARDYLLTLEALNSLLQDARITQDQFTQSVRQARIEFLETQKDIGSGFERGFLKILEKTEDFATQAEQIITRAFDGMSQSIADLVVDGEADFSSLIRSINKQIVQLVVSQAFQKLFGNAGPGAAGAGGGNIFGSLFSGLGSLFGLQSGGSFMVGAGTGVAPIPNGGNDNRLVAFRAQDGETVSVTPRNQSDSGGSTQNVVVNFNISTPDVEGFRRSESQLAARAAKVISRGQRNL